MPVRFFIPLLAFLSIAIALGVGLFLKPAEVPSALVGKAAPEFQLPALDNQVKGLSRDDLAKGQVTIVNFFASWCAPCRVEHPQLIALRDAGYAVHAVVHKDTPKNARQFLDKLGNPFQLIGTDNDGRVSIDWGVYGVPETFIIDGNGNIIYRHVGAIMPDDLTEKILPFLAKVQS